MQPFLLPNTIYAEPCHGEGHLVRQLKEHGHTCGFASDINGLQYNCLELDFSEVTEGHLVDCSAIITNPVWSRDILHPMIEHFSKLKPTWLLFDSDWSYTRQSTPYMKDLCTDIVAVGRLKWIEGTTMSGKDNCAWYRFDINKEQETRFHGR